MSLKYRFDWNDWNDWSYLTVGRGVVRRYCNEGNDILSAVDMREALKAWPVKGCTAAVCEIERTDRTDQEMSYYQSGWSIFQSVPKLALLIILLNSRNQGKPHPKLQHLSQLFIWGNWAANVESLWYWSWKARAVVRPRHPISQCKTLNTRL